MDKKWILLATMLFAIGIMAFASARYYPLEELQKHDYDGAYSRMFEQRTEHPDGSVTIKPPSVFLTREARQILTSRLEAALRQEREKKAVPEHEKVTEKIYSLVGEKYLVSIKVINGMLEKAEEAPGSDVHVEVVAEKITPTEEQPSEISDEYIQGPEEERTD